MNKLYITSLIKIILILIILLIMIIVIKSCNKRSFKVNNFFISILLDYLY